MPDQPAPSERTGGHASTPPAPRLDPERYSEARRFLRIAGPIVLGVGVLCLLISFLSLINAMTSDSGPPRLFFLGFIGIPLIFVGLVMTAYGYKRVIADYTASELSPVASGAVNYLGETTQDGVRAFGGALREGLHGEARAARHCTQCGVRLAGGARFCQGCGVAVVDTHE